MSIDGDVVMRGRISEGEWLGETGRGSEKLGGARREGLGEAGSGSEGVALREWLREAGRGDCNGFLQWAFAAHTQLSLAFLHNIPQK